MRAGLNTLGSATRDERESHQQAQGHSFDSRRRRGVRQHDRGDPNAMGLSPPCRAALHSVRRGPPRCSASESAHLFPLMVVT